MAMAEWTLAQPSVQEVTGSNSCGAHSANIELWVRSILLGGSRKCEILYCILERHELYPLKSHSQGQ